MIIILPRGTREKEPDFCRASMMCHVTSCIFSNDQEHPIVQMRKLGLSSTMHPRSPSLYAAQSGLTCSFLPGPQVLDPPVYRGKHQGCWDQALDPPPPAATSPLPWGVRLSAFVTSLSDPEVFPGQLELGEPAGLWPLTWMPRVLIQNQEGDYGAGWALGLKSPLAKFPCS